MAEVDRHGLKKLNTGILGFDQIAGGGLPKGRSTIIAGPAGSGKTVFALQFLTRGIDSGEPGVFVTFEEAPEDLMLNVRSFGWNLEGLLEEEQLALVDATVAEDVEILTAGSFDLAALLARIEHAVTSIGARRVMLDSVGALFPQFSDPLQVRRELRKILVGMRRLGVTTLMTLEWTSEMTGVGRFGVEEYVADNVLLLRNRLENEKRRRTIEILKFRGTSHQKGEFPFTIDPVDGVSIVPVSAQELDQQSSDVRVSIGVDELDEMCGGGVYQDSFILISGATGTGKTLIVTQYARAAIASGERVLLIGSEESREQLTRNASAWGIDFDAAEREGLLRMVCRYPETMGPEDHFLNIKRDIQQFNPSRVAIDSMSGFERISSEKSFRELVIGLTSHIKQLGLTCLFTNTATLMLGGGTITEAHISTITDTIILLRYVELHGEMRRALAVLKMRGTWHDNRIREYVIDGSGMHIKAPFRGVQGIMGGSPSYLFDVERENLAGMFEG